MKLNKIDQWSQFIYRYISYDNKPYVITFTCPKCGGHACEKIDSIEPDNFWSGYFRCTSCGNRRDESGNQIAYYSECFKNEDVLLNRKQRPADDDNIAELCLKCTHRNTIYLLLDIPFCDYSRTTCARQHNKKKCQDCERVKPVQLSLFD